MGTRRSKLAEMTGKIDADHLSIQTIEACLAAPGSDPTFAEQWAPRHAQAPHLAAVLLPFFLTDEASWQLLFTRRTNSVNAHKGQVAFPGGAMEPGDDFPDGTALREAQEEIGLDPCQVRVLGRLEQRLTISNFLVTPVVGLIPAEMHFHLEPEEVSRVFSIPLVWLAEPEHHEIRRRIVQPTPENGLTQAGEYPVIYFDLYDGELLWGVSAEITLRLLHKLHLLG
jgi:8-oxo-dGTP pyrophosphatase MutT (NUDIX family)